MQAYIERFEGTSVLTDNREIATADDAAAALDQLCAGLDRLSAAGLVAADAQDATVEIAEDNEATSAVTDHGHGAHEPR